MHPQQDGHWATLMRRAAKSLGVRWDLLIPLQHVELEKNMAKQEDLAPSRQEGQRPLPDL